MECKPAVAVVFHHIGPYHRARLNAAADRLSVTGIEWSAKGYDAWGEGDSPARYEKVSLFPEATDYYPRKAELRRAFCSALEQANPDVVAVNGWNNFGSMVAVNCCVRRGLPMVVMSESARGDEPRTWWKEMIKRRIIDLYSAALVGGQRHVEYLVDLGMPRDRIFTGYDVVDNGYFARRSEEIRNSHLRQGYSGQAAFEIRNKHGLPENYFLASARFIEKKNLQRLIRAYTEYCQRSEIRGQKSAVSLGNAPWNLVILGDGPLKPDLCRLISDLRLDAHVQLPGFKQYEELPVYYALAKAFVHASTTEQWGLVVNEAIASGLPVIVSERCGCAPELVQGNGFTFNPTDVDELASRLWEMASLSEHDLKQLGEASRKIAERFGPELFGDGLEQAASVAMKLLTPNKSGITDRALLFVAARYGR
jgi:glycosyltransferase involved in cell wall biosynthesis